MNTNSGEIVQIHGDNILHPINPKDRHTKVYTAKGPRDRRVRLAAHTAIQFYDVQDRLGYDRPSKAIDWLIDKAKTAIDKLDKLPPLNPHEPVHDDDTSFADPNLINLGKKFQHSNLQNPSCSSSSFRNLPQPVNLQDNMKIFMPNSSITFQNYPTVETGNLGHSFQSLQNYYNSTNNQMVFSGLAPRMMDLNREGGLGFVSEFSEGESFLVSRGQFQPEGFSGLQTPAKLYHQDFRSGSGDPS